METKAEKPKDQKKDEQAAQAAKLKQIQEDMRNIDKIAILGID